LEYRSLDEYNIKMNLKDIGYDGVGSVHPTQDRNNLNSALLSIAV